MSFFCALDLARSLSLSLTSLSIRPSHNFPVLSLHYFFFFLLLLFFSALWFHSVCILRIWDLQFLEWYLRCSGPGYRNYTSLVIVQLRQYWFYCFMMPSSSLDYILSSQIKQNDKISNNFTKMLSAPSHSTTSRIYMAVVHSYSAGILLRLLLFFSFVAHRKNIYCLRRLRW